MKSDVRGKYGWVELEETHLQFVSLILSAHSSFRLYITSFDSGAISPTEEERDKGWKAQGGVIVSPNLERGTIVPCDNFDDWYSKKPLFFLQSTKSSSTMVASLWFRWKNN